MALHINIKRIWKMRRSVFIISFDLKRKFLGMGKAAKYVGMVIENFANDVTNVILTFNERTVLSISYLRRVLHC